MDKQPLFVSYLIEERSYVSFVKREIHNLVKNEFNESRTGEIDIIVSELTSNLVKHAGKGELLYRLSKEQDEPVFEILCIDNGPGMKDVQHSMKDGISTTNTLGQGIGSITRLSSLAQIYSQEGWGTIVYSKIYKTTDHKEHKSNFIIRALNVSKPGEMVSGDGFSCKIKGNTAYILAADGLGHGVHAHDAVQAAIKAFSVSEHTDAASIIKDIDKHVKKTRGLVGTVAVLNIAAKTWQLCGVGNIHTRMQQGLEYKNYVCNNGIIGLNIPTRLENSTVNMERYQQLILCSDGIRTRWDLVKYPAILKYDPMILAAAIYKDHARQNDDMTILIVKVI